MFKTKKILKPVVLSVIIFTSLINLLFFAYILYYEVGGYRASNNSAKWQFENSVTQKGSWDNVDYNLLCSNLEPKSFLPIYHTLEYDAALMIKILAITTICFFFLCRKELSKKEVVRLSLIFVVLFIFNFALSAYEADYDFVLPCMDGPFYESVEQSL